MNSPDHEPPFLRAIDQSAFETNPWVGKAGIALVTNELRELFEEAELIVKTAEPLCRIVDIEGSRGLATVFRVATEVPLADMRLHEGQEIRFFSQEQIRELPLDPLIREILNQFFEPN